MVILFVDLALGKALVKHPKGSDVSTLWVKGRFKSPLWRIAGHTNNAAGIRAVGRNINRTLELLGL